MTPAEASHDHARGIALHEAGDFSGAVAAFDRALAQSPGSPRICYSRGNSLVMLNRLGEAIAAYDACLSADASHIQARYNRATALAHGQRWAEALAGLDEVVSHAPTMADAWNNRSGILQELGRHGEALDSIKRVLALRPSDAHAWYNSGILLMALSRFEEAQQAFERALQINPHNPDALGNLVLALTRSCDWAKLRSLLPTIPDAVREGRATIPPVTLLAISDDPALQRICAESATKRCFAGTGMALETPEPLWRQPYRHDRVRLGYISSDFREHPVGRQIATLLERHDREKFELFGLSTGRNDASATRARVAAACDQFHDLSALGSRESANLIRDLEIDILIDLNGQTLGWRPAIFKYRPAPVIATYLGYAGTTGADFIDYIIGDPQVTPFELAPAMSERIVQLPRSFWPGAAGLPEPEPVSRIEAGLPEGAFVFCCFNAHHKISPDMFDGWMRLLKTVPGSVLWLRDASPGINARLVREATARGIDGARLVFAGKEAHFARHLGRQGQADLFLDTFPYNAHVTASDALWAGLPIVTLRGRSYVSRVAASFLSTLGLEELIVESLPEYERLAASLATDPQRLADIRDRLRRARDSAPLFDATSQARGLEQAFVQMLERAERFEAPVAIHAI